MTIVTIDGKDWELGAYAANAGLTREQVRDRLRNRTPPYTSASILADLRAVNVKQRTAGLRDDALRAAVVGLRAANMSMGAIAKAVGRSKARVHQILVSEGYSTGGSCGNGSSS